MSPLVAAVLLALVSSVCYAAAAIVQERLAATVTAQGRGARVRRLLASKRWWLAVVLQGLGALLHVAALGLGPLTVVQPLGAFTLVLAAPMAAMFVKRPVSAIGWRGILLTSAGLAAILLLTAPTGRPRALDGDQQLLLAGVIAGALALLVAAGAAAGHRIVLLRAVVLATAAGVAYGAASVYVKTVVDDWQGMAVPGLLALLLITGALAATGLGASQASYRGAGLTAPLATMTVVNPVIAAVIGIQMLDEGFRYGLPGQLGAVAAGLIAAYGLVLLTADSASLRRGGSVGTETTGAPSPVVMHSPAAAPLHPDWHHVRHLDRK